MAPAIHNNKYAFFIFHIVKLLVFKLFTFVVLLSDVIQTQLMKKNKESQSPFIYSTDPNFKVEDDAEEQATLLPGQQLLRISLETKHRAGKTVTVVLGFIGTEENLTQLGKDLKNHCGTGGAAKEGEIILQGDHREKVKQWLQKKGYKTK
jgi:translation initiation factor 1